VVQETVDERGGHDVAEAGDGPIAELVDDQ
jgi:hypothetical protein